MSKKYLCSLAVAIFLLCFACEKKPAAPMDYGNEAPSTTLRIAGSDTMLPLIDKWAQRYMAREKGVIVETAGGGSGQGVNLLIAEKIDICATSRTLTSDEVKRLHQRRGTIGIRTLTAKDALSVYLHPDNPVRNLSRSQLRKIFSGEYENWNQLGGLDIPIQIIGRQPNSGTWLFFKEHVLEELEYSKKAITQPDTDSVVAWVSRNPGAIGYGGVVYVKDIASALVEGVSPGPRTVRDETYPLTRYLYLYTASPLEGPRRDFIKWVLGVEGQQVVKEIGYFPLWAEDE